MAIKSVTGSYSKLGIIPHVFVKNQMLDDYILFTEFPESSAAQRFSSHLQQQLVAGDLYDYISYKQV